MNFFDPKAYQTYDQPAKRAVSGFLTLQGYEVREGGTYAIDLEIYESGNYRAGLEVEVRRSRLWGSAQAFPFKTHETSSRKTRLKNSGNNYVLTLNGDMSCAIMSPLSAFTEIVTKSPTNNRGEETFIATPNLGASQFVRLH